MTARRWTETAGRDVVELDDRALRKPRVAVDSMGRWRRWPSTAERLRRRLRVADNGCWEWQGYRNPKGYGQIGGPDDRNVATHRVAYVLAFGPIPDGMIVMHRCDNPPCCNPAHLIVGTSKDNTQDMLSKGRGVAPKSLRNGRAKLSDGDVDQIRAAHSAGESCKSIARRTGLNASYVGRLVRQVRRPQVTP